jgi:AcrR family transcriptional regulator
MACPTTASGYTVCVTQRGGTRERILKVSKSLFAARGYEHASTSSIAREAGTSESQLMKHFGSKAGLLEAIFTENWSRITAEARIATQDIASPREKLTVLSGLIVGVMERDPELKLLLLLEGRRIRREGQMIVLTEGFMSFVELLDSILEEIRDAGQLRPGLHPQAIRSALMGMLEGMMRDRFLAERLGYPAAFDAQQVEAILGVTLASCVLPASAGAV